MRYGLFTQHFTTPSCLFQQSDFLHCDWLRARCALQFRYLLISIAAYAKLQHSLFNTAV